MAFTIPVVRTVPTSTVFSTICDDSTNTPPAQSIPIRNPVPPPTQDPTSPTPSTPAATPPPPPTPATGQASGPGTLYYPVTTLPNGSIVVVRDTSTYAYTVTVTSSAGSSSQIAAPSGSGNANANHSSIGAIVGGAVAGAVLLLFITFLLWRCP